MKLFIWDFHGVLERDNDKAVLEITNEVLKQAGYTQRLSEQQNREYYGLKWHQYFEKLLPHLAEQDHKALQAACFTFAEKNLNVLAKHIRPTDHAISVLQDIHAAGHDQIILSNTRPHDLLWFVDTVGLRSCFSDEKIIGVNAHETFGTKQDALHNYIQVRDFDQHIVIGDSESDMQLADVAEGTTFFYRHPHLPSKQKPASADHHIDDLRKILQEI